MRWLERYLTEGKPRLQHYAELVAGLAARDPASDEPNIAAQSVQRIAEPTT